MTFPEIAGGTPQDLISAAALGARIETRKRRYQGYDDDSIRRAVIGHYKQDFAEEYGEFTQETLIGAVQRAVEEALQEILFENDNDDEDEFE
jgi:histone H3/H4